MSRFVAIVLLAALVGCAKTGGLPSKPVPGVQVGDKFVVLHKVPTAQPGKEHELLLFYSESPDGEKFVAEGPALQEYLERMAVEKTLLHLAKSAKARIRFFADEDVRFVVVEVGEKFVRCRAELEGKYVEDVIVLRRIFKQPSKHLLRE